MDVNTLNSIPINSTTATNPSGLNVTEAVQEASENTKSVMDRLYQEPAMMDLEDVQNFLYLLIGSDVLVEARNNNLGSSFDSFA